LMSFVPIGRSRDFSSYVLVIPAVSVGNVAQLAVDALLCSLKSEKVGFLHDRNIAPVVGNDTLATSPNELKGSLGLSAEMFACSSRKLLLLQMRAPILLGKEGSFCFSLFRWVREAGISKVILLSSSPAALRGDEQLGSAFAFRANSAWGDRPNLGLPLLENPSRLGRKLEAGDIPVLELTAFTHEGDNSAGGVMLAQCVDHVLATLFDCPKTEVWRVPLAWSTVFGPPPDARLY